MSINPKLFVLLSSGPFRPNSAPDLEGLIQFTNLRSRTLFTNPSIRKIDQVFEPPALISGSGIPVTGILPTTIPRSPARETAAGRNAHADIHSRPIRRRLRILHDLHEQQKIQN